jgi:mTERF domain-containing protein
MFRHAVPAVSCMFEEKLAAKLEFFKRTLCCSESQVSTAVSKAPYILGFSDENIGCKVEFLINEACPALI